MLENSLFTPNGMSSPRSKFKNDLRYNNIINVQLYIIEIINYYYNNYSILIKDYSKEEILILFL